MHHKLQVGRLAGSMPAVNNRNSNICVYSQSINEYIFDPISYHDLRFTFQPTDGPATNRRLLELAESALRARHVMDVDAQDAARASVNVTLDPQLLSRLAAIVGANNTLTAHRTVELSNRSLRAQDLEPGVC